jgi:uncharacterized protein YbaR (Trm112 family)
MSRPATSEPGIPAEETEGSWMLDDRLLTLLACPVDKEALLYFPDDCMLYNPRLRRGYEVETGIPVLLADHAEDVSAEVHRTLVARVERGEAAATLGRSPAELVKGDAAGIE